MGHENIWEMKPCHEFGSEGCAVTHEDDVARQEDGEEENPAGNCIKIGLPGKSILGDHFLDNRSSRRPFLLLRISFPGRPIFIQFVPDGISVVPEEFGRLTAEV